MEKLVHFQGLVLKHEAMKVEWSHLTFRMQAIVMFVNHVCVQNLSVIPIWTCFYRPKKRGQKPSSHWFGRSCDMARRVFDLKGAVGYRTLTKDEIQMLLGLVNETFPYGKRQYKTGIYHKVRRGALHFHWQSAI